MEIILLWKLFLFFAKDFLNCETKADKVCLTNAISYKREEGAHPMFQYRTKNTCSMKGNIVMTRE